MLRVRMFGRFEVWRGESLIPESAWFTRQAKQLFKILLLARGKPVPADQLLDWLWPQADPQRAAITLRSTVHALRRALEPDRPPRASQYILSQPPGYAVAHDAPLWVDVWTFEDLLEAVGRTDAPEERRARLVEALALYRDDLLIEDPYAEWALAERERLRERFIEAALDLAELLAGAGTPEKAIPLCRRVLMLDEFREPAYRALMRYQIAVGDIAGALSTYERCRQVLREAFGVEPSPPTRALYEALLRGELQPARLGAPRPVQDLPIPEGRAGEIFVGREGELERLQEVFGGFPKGHGGVAILIGEPGAGKTRLAVEAIRRFAPDADVLHVRGLFIERTLPFSCLAEGLRRLLSQLPEDRRRRLPTFALAQVARLIPSLHLIYSNLPSVPETTPEENRHRLVDSFSNLIITLADQHPLVVFADDLHWADEATLTVVGRLARRASRHSLVLLLVHTPEEEPEGREVSHLLETLRREGIGRWIRVGRLPVEAITRWLAQWSGEPPERLKDLAHRLYSLTEGNALFTAELLRAALGMGEPFRRETLERYLEGPAAISSLRALIADRIARLPEQAREILEIAAVIGRAFPVQWLELVGPPDPEPYLRILLDRHFLQEDSEDRLSFVHEVVRRVIYEAIPPVVRRRQHLRLAEALAALYGPHPGPYSVEIAYHFQRAGRSALPAMVRYAVEAGDHARQAYGFRQAVRHYDEALSAASLSPHKEGLAEWIRRAYLGRGMALEALGDWEGIVETYTRFREWAETHGDRVHALNAARRLMTTLAMLGRLEEAGDLAGEIRAQFAAALSLAETDLLDRLELVFGEEVVASPSGEGFFQPAPPLWGRPWVELAEATAPEQAPLLLNLYGWILTLQGMSEPAEACLHQALAIAEATAQWPHVVMSCNLMAYLQDLRGDFTDAQAWLNKGLQLARRVPEMDWSTIWARIFQGYLALRARQLEEAQAQFQSVLTLLKGQSALRAHRLSAQIGLGMVFLARGDLERATALLDEALAQGRAVDAVARSVGLVGEARLARLRGRFDEARSVLEQALQYTGRRGLVVEFVHAAVEAGRWARAVGHPEEARPVLEEASRWADAAGFRPAALMSRIALGKLLRAAGEVRALEAVREEARRLWRTLAARLPDGEPVERYLVPREVVESI
ncbi:MAG TPA: AAA family ATPase [Thermoflexus sp.]|nr:AAA family ATPase [Thermoflexus sp.]